jgi:predicted Rossmann fold nucleotide-binding protein DprA/Smf involved in DNA uptake
MPPGEAMSLDVLMAETGLSAPRVLERLLEAELAGAVERTGAGRFCRLDR